MVKPLARRRLVVIRATLRARIIWLIRTVILSAAREKKSATMSSALVEAIGGLAAILTTLCWVPQALKIARERETRAISLPSTMLSVLGLLLWLVYGLAIADAPLIGSSAVTFAITAMILALKIRHG